MPALYGRRYPWDVWGRKALRRPLVLRRGDDFNGRPDCFGVLCRRSFADLGAVSVSISDDGERVTVRVIPRKGVRRAESK